MPSFQEANRKVLLLNNRGIIASNPMRWHVFSYGCKDGKKDLFISFYCVKAMILDPTLSILIGP
jgi:hypothetical protein